MLVVSTQVRRFQDIKAREKRNAIERVAMAKIQSVNPALTQGQIRSIYLRTLQLQRLHVK
jgi:hypothetical protein